MDASYLDTCMSRVRRHTLLNGAASHSRRDIHFMHLPTTSIRYRLAGSTGPTLVFATDPPVMLEHYDALIDELSRDHRVVVFEVPAFGFSVPANRMDLHFPAATASMRDFLQRLGLGPYVLALPCVIGYSSISIAASDPALVAAVVMIQTPHWHEEIRWKHGRDPKHILGRPYVGQLLLKWLKAKRAGGWYAAALGDPKRLTEFLEPTLKAFRHGALFSLATAFQQYLVEQEPALKPVSQPTLVVWGDADRSHCHTDKSSSLRYAPHAQVHHFKDAGHFPELEQIQRFSSVLREFLAGIKNEKAA